MKINLDELVEEQAVFSYKGKDYNLKTLTYRDYKEANKLFRGLTEETADFEAVEKFITFMIPEFTTKNLEGMTIPQMAKLMEMLSSSIKM